MASLKRRVTRGLDNTGLAKKTPHKTKLTKEQAAEIRHLYRDDRIMQKDIAMKFNISQSMVSMIVQDRCWNKESPQTSDLMTRFLSLISIGDGCWEWLGYREKSNGYGRTSIGSDSTRSQNRINAHQLAFLLFEGSIPEGLFVCHTCDNPPCVRPSHLFLGTPLQNQHDSIEKKRKLHGEQIANHKLTTDMVIEIRKRFEAGEAKRALGRRFGVHRKTIKRIVERTAWPHI